MAARGGGTVRASGWARWGAYVRLMRLHRPIGSLLLLWPTLWALWLAGRGHPDPILVAVFVAGVLIMRSAGCVINDYADRDFDGHVWRTRERPIASGEVSPRDALIVFAGLCLLAALLAFWLNTFTIELAFVAVALAASYPFFKRFTHLPQVYLGLAFGWGIPMAFAAETGRIPLLAWVLLAANVAWTIAYDTAYAMADRDDDLKIGVKSSAILFGHWDRAMVALSHAIALGLLYWAGVMAHLGPLYDAGLGFAAGFALYEQGLLRDREPRDCFRAFLNNNWFGGSVFVGLVAAYLGRSL
ncbi:4-hydroxybenzoate octaprenyltransferase [Acidiferrobacter sp.]|uniref:4-hydroxybenzoate octaprenyltransferase n=1 Tax=Acidiferrobacter sp. TaxID=1872107 RepID=UPI00345BBA4C